MEVVKVNILFENPWILQRLIGKLSNHMIKSFAQLILNACHVTVLTGHASASKVMNFL